jgi:hypothetical protein
MTKQNWSTKTKTKTGKSEWRTYTSPPKITVAKNLSSERTLVDIFDVLNTDQQFSTVAQFLVPDWGDKVDYGKVLYQLVRLHRLAGRYHNPTPQSTFSPP